jgi:predicted GTPase
MISLVQLLKEVQSQPKAILMAGPAGAGKSYTLNQLGLQGFTILMKIILNLQSVSLFLLDHIGVAM